ncbi:MAG: DegV family protein [Chloroflexota bacterium]|nr:DegV family protein [Chloroflexota bacterium]
MPDFHIITDSGVQVGSLLNSELPITVIPNRISTPQQSIQEASDPEGKRLAELSRLPQPITIEPPTPEAYAQAFATAARNHDGLLCIVPSRHISAHYQRAQAGAALVAGACPIHVFDSQSVSAGQTLIAMAAVRLIQQASTLDAVENALRGAIARLYMLLYVERVEVLAQREMLNEHHALFSAMLNLKPLLTMEHGHLAPMDKARSRAQALDRLFDFAVEFSDSARMLILHDHEGEDTAERLQQRLGGEVSCQIDTMVYNASLAALIGLGAVGIVIQEHLHA